RVGNEAAKAAERHGGEGEDGRRIFERLNARKFETVPVKIQGLLHPRDAEKQNEGKERQKNFFQAQAHCVPCAVASSRRLKTEMPKAAIRPPMKTMTWRTARPSCSQEMLRPVLSESMGENSLTRLMSQSMPRNMVTVALSSAFGPSLPV